MRTILRAFLLGAGLLSFQLAVFSQQVARSIPYPASPDGVIGFLEFRPADYGSQKHPLIIFLHGVGERGNGTSQIGMVAYNSLPNMLSRGTPTMRFTAGGQTSSFVVISPQLSTAFGYWPTFYVKEMIKYAKANLQVDPNRIYVTGLSLGGGGVWRLITDSENFDYSFDAQIAAAAPICGTQEENDANYCSTVGANHLPVWAHHSMDDYQVGVGATQHAELLSKNCGVTPVFKATYYQYGGHGGAWVNAYDTGHITTTVNVNGVQTSYTASPNLYEWFLMNSRSAAPPPAANRPPVVSAGYDINIVQPANSVTLNGTASDPDGYIASYLWTSVSAPAGFTITSPGTAVTTVTNMPPGKYVFNLKVTDNSGATASSSMNVNVNVPPVVNTNTNIAVTLPVNSVTLDANASTDTDGMITGWEWTKISGPSSYNIVSPYAGASVIDNLAQGTYVFGLKVSDNAQGVSYANVTITVNPEPVSPPASGPPPAANQAPFAYAGADVSITLPVNSVSLDGSGSYDADGKIVEYYWLQAAGPSSSVIANNFSTSTTVSNLVEGTYVFGLQVKDNAGALSYSYKTVKVQAAAANQAPLSNAGADVSITLPVNSVSLDGSGSYDPDGKIVEYYWYQTSGPSSSVIANSFSASSSVGSLIAGTYVFGLQVKDNAGTNSYSYKTVKVLAATANQAPLSNAGADVSIMLPVNSVSLDGSGSYDPDGKIVEYYWYLASGPSSSVIENNFSASTSVGNLVEGTYVFGLQVKDNAGTNSYSYKTVKVLPAAASNQAPFSNPGADISVTLPVSSVSLDGSGSYDPDGKIVEYYWYQVSGPSATAGIGNYFSATTTISNMVAGTYILGLQVKDNTGAFGYSYKKITVLPGAATTTAASPSSYLLGYIKISTGPFQACDDASADGRMPVYGTGISNGNFLYTDAALTQKFDGGWNWFSFTPVPGGAVTAAFAVYPIGSIGLLTNCGNAGARGMSAQSAVTEEDIAALQRLRDAAGSTVTTPLTATRLSMYPNPVQSSAVIIFTSAENGVKIINLYSAGGVLQSKFTWNVIKGRNVFSLKNAAVLTPGLYIIDVRNSNGSSSGKLKFIKM